ncbi:hypothetical protein [Streptomyces sp. NPDC006610]|uniref:hypothetical protein n=1 Tax=Streptomyces sp. NPDC006610 TaxID=3154584 RepID=UPI0033BB7A37
MHRPRHPYRASADAAASPDCGHRCTRTSADRPGARCAVPATSAWTVTWRVEGAETNAGGWTETRTSTRPVVVGEAQQVLNWTRAESSECAVPAWSRRLLLERALCRWWKWLLSAS